MSVSVVIPAYNAGGFIEDAIGSVLRQDMPADEIIVINDGSTDRDYADLQRLHPTIRVIQQPNQGVSAARNLGCDVATGDYVALQDADDIWLPRKLREQMVFLTQNAEYDAAFCLGYRWTPNPSEAHPTLPSPDHLGSAPATATRLSYEDFLCSVAAVPATLVVKKSVWKSLGGFNERMRYGEDRDFCLRLSHRHRVGLLKFIGMLYRQHPNSATAKIQQRNHWAETIENAVDTLGLTDTFGHSVDRSRLKRHLSHVHFIHGYSHFWSGSFQVAQREFAQASRMAPLTPRALTYLALSSTPGIRDLVRRSRLQREEPSQFE